MVRKGYSGSECFGLVRDCIEMHQTDPYITTRKINKYLDWKWNNAEQNFKSLLKNERKITAWKSLRYDTISVSQLLNTHDAHKLDFKLLTVNKIEVFSPYIFLKCCLQDFKVVKRNEQSRDRLDKQMEASMIDVHNGYASNYG